MKLTEITATYGGKLNLGDYNSVHIELTASAIVDEGETLEQASEALFSACRQQVRARSLEFLARKQATVEQVFAGLPVEVQQSIKG
jgi:hypothetical protein